MKSIETNTQLSDYGNYAQEFLTKFPDVNVDLIDMGYDYDCDRRRFHQYLLAVSKKNATAEMLQWADERDLLGNDGYGLDDDADDDDAAIEFTLDATDDGDLWIVEK